MIIPESTVDPMELINRRILDLLRLKEKMAKRRPLNATMEPSALATKEHIWTVLIMMSACKNFPMKSKLHAEMEVNISVKLDLTVTATTIPISTVDTMETIKRKILVLLRRKPKKKTFKAFKQLEVRSMNTLALMAVNVFANHPGMETATNSVKRSATTKLSTALAERTISATHVIRNATTIPQSSVDTGRIMDLLRPKKMALKTLKQPLEAHTDRLLMLTAMVNALHVIKEREDVKITVPPAYPLLVTSRDFFALMEGDPFVKSVHLAVLIPMAADSARMIIVVDSKECSVKMEPCASTISVFH